MESASRPLLILGTGSFAIEIADIVSDIPGFRVIGFVQSTDPEKRQQTVEGLPVFWVADVEKLADTHWAVCAIGTTQRARFIEQVEALGMRFTTVVHPTARMSSKSSLGEGTIISAGVVIASHTRLGRHVIVNRGALIGHHTEIGDYVTIGPGANIAGSCRIGERTFIGMGAIVKDHIEIGSHSLLGAGAVVTKQLGDNVVVAAAASRVVK